ncbi:MAG: hypothetical protein ACSHWW_13305 [Nonlabens sp.]|uniref:hypothetical protein n=1 Tax=Nonlabens sp. TaxID=1888209 RepID=UPI003EF64458
MEKERVIVRDNAPNLFFNLLGAVAIMVFFTLVVTAFTSSDFTKDAGWKQWAGMIFSAILVLAYGLKPILVQQVQLDLNKNKYQKGYLLGPVSLGKWNDLPVPDYISIFRQPLKNGKFNFEMNLWYDDIRHIELFYFDDGIIGYDASLQVARALKVTLVDARVPNETIEIPFKD